MRDFMITKLQFTEEEVRKIEYQRIHRVQSGVTSPKPIKVRYLRYKDKVAVQQRAKLLKGTQIYITDDLSKRVRMIRKSQMAALTTARRAGKLAFFSKVEPTKLYIDHVWLPLKDQQRFLEKYEKIEEKRKTRDQPTQREMERKEMPKAVRPKSPRVGPLAMETDGNGPQGASAGNCPVIIDAAVE